MKFRPRITTGLFLLLYAWSTLCYAEIYKWRDKDGNLHFGDKPPSDVESNTVKLKINTYQNVEVMDAGKWASDRDKKKNHRVVMYSASWCGVCKKAKRYFRKNHIPFQDYDVETSAKGKRDFASMNGKAVPILLVGTSRMNGFTPSHFEALYNREASY